MHLLTAQAGGIQDGLEPVDLEQLPGDIVVLSAADTELAMLARCYNKQSSKQDGPSLRLANLMQLGHNYSVDLYIEKTLKHAKLIIVRLLGGSGYWQYGIDELARLARSKNIMLAVLPGDSAPDKSLAAYNTLDQHHCDKLWDYLVEGGIDNMRGFLAYASFLTGTLKTPPAPAKLLPKLGILEIPSPAQPAKTQGIAALVFYRALVQADDLAPIFDITASLQKQGLSVLPLYVTSLKDSVVAQQLEQMLNKQKPDIIINMTGFALSSPSSIQDTDWQGTVLDKCGAPVLQAVLSGMNEQSWQESARGLGARDIAMNVALPEIDGRIFSRAISFKAQRSFDDHTQSAEVWHKPVADRVDYVAKLAARWGKLRHIPAKDKKVALIMANYPSAKGNRSGRMANGVGLDTPQSTVNLLQAMQQRGYTLHYLPKNSADLMALVANLPTQQNTAHNNQRQWKRKQSLPLHLYSQYFNTLPPYLQKQISERWGNPQADPKFCDTEQSFHLDIHLSGNIAVGFQPSRGFDIDEKLSHHDLELVPTHNYLAFYFYLRHSFNMDAIIHMGKHGNLEWQPGKALGLSKDCFPELILGATPHIYPFIVNDPGEGTQAKRRCSAVIIDHLTPPLTRAESYGALRDLEALVDEYYEASSLDPRRMEVLGEKIINMARSTGIDQDCGIEPREKGDSALAKLDNFLCDLKDLQIRDGLHIFGSSPQGSLEHNLLLALTRIARGNGKDGNASLTSALAHDLSLTEFDPLTCDLSQSWTGVKPQALQSLSDNLWRTNSDTVERLETLALNLVSGLTLLHPSWVQTAQVMEQIETSIKPRVKQCGIEETNHLFDALQGRFVPPGASGAPTRGRLDVLPTGRNFYSLDSRTVPTQSAWELGLLSAQNLVTAYLQQHGEWPQQFGITAWGTANMRTGGDDIAQAMALIGVKPVWENSSRRVTGFEVISLSELRRPRIDVLIRISGFFRDAFPVQLDLLESAISTVASLDEPDDMNPLAADQRKHPTSFNRIFGSAPGQYGSGLEDLLSKRENYDPEALAQAYLKAGSFVYGGNKEGEASNDFASLLKRLDGVIQNQDNREYDILDSDAFAAYEGGMAIAASHNSENAPTIYHNDLSNPAKPIIRTLQDEIARIVRGRAANPQWIKGVMRHGYKGGSEMAQTAHNLLSLAQTTGLTTSHHFEQLFEAYLVEPETLSFFKQHNPEALQDIALSLSLARDQNFWYPKRNSAHDYLTELMETGQQND